MLRLPIKKTGIQLKFKLKKQTHPWDLIGEVAKTKHAEQQQKIHKNFSSIHVEPANQLSQTLITPQETYTEQNLDNDEQIFDELEGAEEGFFLCPSCTCWFTHKKDLNYHIKNWCDREQVNV
jgi:hypothetical protein